MKYIDKWILEAIENEKKNNVMRIKEMKQMMKSEKKTMKEFCKIIDCWNCHFLRDPNCELHAALLAEKEIDNGKN